jgi:hypothetical protein
VLENDCVFLKGALRRIVTLLVDSDCMTENTITYFETRDGFPDLNDLAREIRTEDAWVFDPGKNEVDGATG